MPWARTFGVVAAGEPLLYEDSYGRACIAVNQGSAAAALGLVEGTRLQLRRR
jgi:S-adenosylmethionine hydrolase